MASGRLVGALSFFLALTAIMSARLTVAFLITS